MAVLVVCGVDEHDQRNILAIEPLLEEWEEVYLQLFRGLQERGICTSRLVVSDAHAGLVAAIRRRTGVVGIFSSADAYTRLVTTYLMEYAEDWSASKAYLSEQSVQPMLRPAA